MVEHGAFVGEVVCPVELLLDLGVSFLWAVDLYLLWVAHDTGGQLLDARRKGSAKHHCLAAIGCELVDFGQIVSKAQVEHAVGFVNNQELDLFEFDLHGALQVKQAAWSGYDQIGVLQFGDLQCVGHAAYYVCYAQVAAVFDQVDSVVRDLLCQLTRRAQNECAWGGCFEVAAVCRVFAAWFFGGGLAFGGGFVELGLPCEVFCCFAGLALLQQGVQHGQQEGGGFAATCLAGNHQVDVLNVCAVACQRQRYGLRLYDGGLLVAQIQTGLHQRLCQLEFDKAVGRFGIGLLIGSR